ncbi:hypothetical protein ACR9E3_17665 [Actinomycetospora sp. C-140]
MAAVAQGFVLVSAVALWTGHGEASEATAVAPVSWTGVVHDVGAAGVNLRSAPQAIPETSRDTAGAGSRLSLTCARSGDLVTDESGAHSDMWLRTSDGLYVSLLYVDVRDRTSIVSCADATGDAPVMALDEPDGGTVSPSAQPVPASDVQPAAAPARTPDAVPPLVEHDPGGGAGGSNSVPGGSAGGTGRPDQGQENPGHEYPGQENPGQENPVQQDPGQQEPGQQEPGVPGSSGGGSVVSPDGGLTIIGPGSARAESHAPSATSGRSSRSSTPRATTTTRVPDRTSHSRDVTAVG